MHSLVYAILSKEDFNLEMDLDGLEDKIFEALEELRQCECNNYDEEDNRLCNCVNLFDWGQLGGRWTGYLSGYEASKDRHNLRPCILCENDQFQRRYNGKWIECNGCDGTGISIEWPTSWKKHDGDIQSVEEVLEKIRSANEWDEKKNKFLPYYIITPSKEIYCSDEHKDEDDREKWLDKTKDILADYAFSKEYFLAVLDLHN